MFHLPPPVHRNRRPDVAFVSYQSYPRERAVPSDDGAWEVVPDLAVEVVSPNDMAEEVMTKVTDYLRAGARLVWVIYPRLVQVIVFESLTQVRGLTRTDTLDGGIVLPGFTLPLATLFPPPATS
jgi:Uma2 family endonuclease